MTVPEDVHQPQPPAAPSLRRRRLRLHRSAAGRVARSHQLGFQPLHHLHHLLKSPLQPEPIALVHLGRVRVVPEATQVLDSAPCARRVLVSSPEVVCALPSDGRAVEELQVVDERGLRHRAAAGAQ